MTKIFNKKEFANKRRHLRKSMTRAEIFLWSRLKRKQLNGLEFRRQYGINNYTVDTFDGAKPRFLNRGKKRRSVSTLSIPRASDRGVEWVDFYCPELKLAIEIDGDVHGYNSRIVYDKQRQSEIESLGIKVLRYMNKDIIKNINGVLQDIVIKTAPQSPPSQGGDFVVSSVER